MPRLVLIRSSMLNPFFCAIGVWLVLAVSVASAAPVLKATELRTEYRSNPLGIGEAKPRLSWLLASVDEKSRGQRQTAYQILVASSEQKLAADEGDLWDTGKKKSD